jgi:predicted lipoprotein with Yx(FWY)xxD motif
VLASTLVVGLTGLAWASPAGATPKPPAPSGAVVTSLSTTTYGSVLTVGGTGPLAGAPLYLVSSDARGKFGCTTTLESTYMGQITCTGPESDIFNNVLTDEWPAFTTTGRPVAGRGVSDDLLGTVYRPGIGRQVTYAGHPLYLFDPPSNPFVPVGEGFLETVAPLPPWHGLWDLVSSHKGQPAPGPATIETGTLPDGSTTVAVEEYPNAVPGGAAITAYSFSRDHYRDIDCTGACAVTWIPVLTTGPPQVAGGIAAKDVGVVRRADGTHQVTYKGKPLYLYSSEQAVFTSPSSPPSTTGTVGNGNGLRGPDGGHFSIVAPG